MNLRHAQYILTVLQEGSISAAAKKLFISQPSLSQMIKTAENALGTPILNRSTEPISLTQAGQLYVDTAKRILALDSNLQKAITELSHQETGTIRLGIPVQRALQVIPYVLPKFRELYPFVSLQIFEHGSRHLESMILDGSVDIACPTTSPKYEELNYILIKTEELVLLAGNQTDLACRIPSGTPIEITEAKQELFVAHKKDHSTRVTMDALFASYDIQPEIILETSNVEVGKRTALACGAVIVLPATCIETSINASVYPIKGIENRRSFYVCHRKDRYLPQYMEDFISILTAEEKPFLLKYY